MNSHIVLLNALGDRALEFAWPMFWQSSLLIVALLCLDLVLRKRIRPGTLHLLWMILLVKLLLPPSLALPFGAGWWLRPTAPDPAGATTLPRVIVAYGASHQAEPPWSATPVAAPVASPALSAATWALLFTAFVSAGLCAWMLSRWRTVRREAQQSSEPPTWLMELMEDTRLLSGARHPVRLKLLNRASSPAVCGLWRPTILIPKPLVEQLTRKQLQGVLLHELAHLRRGDLWTNCVQTLLQIAYWWHPLLWIANTRIRQVREEAVDEAVMLGLKAEAHTYAPTLLEVARMALPRPINTLGLVGILESHGTLKRRIEKLLDFRAPQRARLRFVPILCILAFGAFAVPMGQAPSPDAEAESALLVRSTPAALEHPNTAVQALTSVQLLIQARFIEVPASFAETLPALLTTNQFPLPAVRLHSPFTGLLTPEQTATVLKSINRNPDVKLISESSLITLSGRQCQMQVLDVTSVVTNINQRALQPPGISSQAEAAGELYMSDDLALGSNLDVLPWISADTRQVQLAIKASVTGFSGYTDVDSAKTVTVYIDGKPRTERLPQPILSRREAEANAILPNAHSLLLSLHARHGGQPAPQDSAQTNNLLCVVLTPTVVTNTGEKLETQAGQRQ